MTDFDLRIFVRTTLHESSEADPRDVADLVFARIEPEYRDLALRESLRCLVYQMVAAERRPLIAARPPQPSSKREMIAQHHKRALDNRIATPDGWKFLRDCTVVDLVFCAESRRVSAAKYLAVAAAYDRLAELLGEHGAAVVADLPDDVLAQALGAVTE